MCAGGVIAYEMAAQLVHGGESVEFVALLDVAHRERETERANREAAIGAAAKWFRYTQQPALTRRARVRLLRRSRAQDCKYANVGKYADVTLWSVRARFRLLRRTTRARKAVAAIHTRTERPPDLRYSRAHYLPMSLSDAAVVLVRAQAGDGSDTPYREIYADETFGWSAVSNSLAVVTSRAVTQACCRSHSLIACRRADAVRKRQPELTYVRSIEAANENSTI